MKLKIKHKLYLIVAIVMLGFLALFINNNINQNTLSSLVTIKGDLQKMQVLMLQLRRAEKDFLLRKDVKYLTAFTDTVKHMQSIVTALKSDLTNRDIPIGRTADIASGVIKYQNKFKELVDESVIKGLDKDSGNYGKLRNATHQLEDILAANNNLQAQVYLLTLRRHEKDFMLRNDEKYLGRLSDVAQQLNSVITDPKSKQLLTNYAAEFESFVAISKKIGLDSESGIQGEMRKLVHVVEEDLATEVPRINQYIEDERNSNQVVGLVVTILLSAVVLIVVMIVVQQIIVPLQTFSKRITEIRIGNDLTQRVEESEDEIGEISKQFNILMAHFQQLIQSINKTVESLESSTSIVSNSVDKTSKGLQNQSIESELIVSAVTEMGMAANEISRNAQNTKDKTDKAAVRADEGKDKLGITVAQIDNLSNELIEAGSNIVKLQEKSDGINAVLEVIKAIAEQTNLLALNAAIEAARAGEQGRGFAVVADEVRTLAVRTQKSTAEITNIISELQSTTSEIVIKVNLCKDQGITSVSQAKDTEQVLNEIMTDVSSIADMTVQVATAAEQQSAVVGEVDRSLVKMRDIGLQVANDSEENANASKQVATLAEALHKEAKIFKV